MQIDRNFTIDLARGILFILMMNTHALTLAGVARTHWLFSDMWLPNGWATVVFVVLSGFGVGFIFYARPVSERVQSLTKRSGVILMVMLVSNSGFAVLRQILSGNPQPVFAASWWIGFLTLETEWTISGVLFPTAMILLLGNFMIKIVSKWPWLSLAMLLVCKILLKVLIDKLSDTAVEDAWVVKFFLTEGFGGFPVIPFVINGLIGIWFGVQKYINHLKWLPLLGVFAVIQFVVYGVTFIPEVPYWLTLVFSLSAIGKFSVIYFFALILTRYNTYSYVAGIAMIGKFALASFIMHRVFLQTIGLALVMTGFGVVASEFRYLVLFGGTLFLTWALCQLRTQFRMLNHCFTRLGL